MQLALFEPEIPPNTGNIARTCAAFGVTLNLVGSLGFSLEDRYLRRAGLDYWPHVNLKLWNTWNAFAEAHADARLVMASTKAATLLPDFCFQPEDIIVLGPETRGLPEQILNSGSCAVRIPIRSMTQGGVRSLNLSTAAGILLWQALLQRGLLPG